MNVHLDYGVFQIDYHSELKCPNCVIETFDGFPDQPINRKDFTNKFQPDLNLLPEHRLETEDYDRTLVFGMSYGHNAPAAFHKSSPRDYLNTFLLSNVCCQSMTFNCGLYHLCEEWTARIIKHFHTVTVLTGNIKGAEQLFDDVWLHVPSFMYKIILI